MDNLTPEQQERYDSTTNTMASFALEGLQPSEWDLAIARDYVLGIVTLDEALEAAKRHYIPGYSSERPGPSPLLCR